MELFRIVRTERLGWRDALLGLALFAAIVRSLIPQGFMPSMRDGQFAMVICTADGAKTLDGAGRPASGVDGVMASAHGPCAFAAVATLAPPPSAPIIVSLPVAVRSGLVARDATPLQQTDPPFRPQAQRAPPSLQT